VTPAEVAYGQAAVEKERRPRAETDAPWVVVERRWVRGHHAAELAAERAAAKPDPAWCTHVAIAATPHTNSGARVIACLHRQGCANGGARRAISSFFAVNVAPVGV
jgi:hypothetical protein